MRGRGARSQRGPARSRVIAMPPPWRPFADAGAEDQYVQPFDGRRHRRDPGAARHANRSMACPARGSPLASRRRRSSLMPDTPSRPERSQSMSSTVLAAMCFCCIGQGSTPRSTGRCAGPASVRRARWIPSSSPRCDDHARRTQAGAVSLLRRAPRHDANTREKFAKIERFRHMVVGSELESDHAIHGSAPAPSR